MSIYGTGSEAFRDTTKWLVAFVPIASLVAAGAVIAPRLLSDATAADSPAGWVGDNVLPLVGVLAVLGGIILVTYFGAQVLSTQPREFTELLTNRENLSRAFSAGAGAPYFLDEAEFRTALGRLDAEWSEDDEQKPSDALVARAVGATELVREWALHDALGTAFNRFFVSFGVGTALILVGFVLAAATLEPEPGRVGEPKIVQVTVNADGARDLKKATGCREPDKTTFVAVAGRWDAPVLNADGTGCRFGATWKPDRDDIELRIPPSHK